MGRIDGKDGGWIQDAWLWGKKVKGVKSMEVERVGQWEVDNREEINRACEGEDEFVKNDPWVSDRWAGGVMLAPLKKGR